MVNWSRFSYPKLFLLLLTFVFAYFIFRGEELYFLQELIHKSGLFGVFIAGMGVAYGFTSAPATVALLVIAKSNNVLITGFLAGLGALVSDMLIFKFLRFSFSDEIKKLSREKILRKLGSYIPLKVYLLPVLAGFIIASPLPDELGVYMLAASRKVSFKVFTILSYIFNTFGIFVILLIGKSL